MNYKIYIYIICIFLSIFALSGVNFEKITRRDKVNEIRILVFLLSFILGYLVANFIFDFISCTQII